MHRREQATFAVALLVALVGCGRDQTHRCIDRQTRPCVDGCGEGRQFCVDGAWTECEVPTVERACRNACGEGVQTCAEGRFGPCVVPPTTFECDNACGEGIATCVDGVRGPCEVPATTVECDNACGSGTARCVDGVIGTCEVPPTQLSCEGACGEGFRACVDGVLSGCVVPPTPVACEGVCGVGTALCVDGEIGECETARAERPCQTECGVGTQVCEEEQWGACSAGYPRAPRLTVTVRDFRDVHPDFEAVTGTDRGIVADVLGPDDKPVYAGPTPTTHGRVAFDQWYRDVPGVNLRTGIDLVLRPADDNPDLFVFDDQTFFPIDDRLFGNEGRAHNFHFTLEARTEFFYRGGETFRFRGDDDVFVFIDRRLVIDLGGVHPTQEATVRLDDLRAALGLEIGGRYPIHLFFAERHTGASTFSVETTVADSGGCD